MTLRVLTAGETLAAFSSPTTTPIMRGHSLNVSLAGSESNVAIGLSRLGVGVRWVGCVGDDALGRMIVRELAAEGVDVVSRVVSDAPTAVLIKERISAEQWRVAYNRGSSAGSRLVWSDVDVDAARNAGVELVHVTGITLALGEGPREAVTRAVRAAHDSGLRVSLDVNFRQALWSTDEAVEAIRPLLPLVDVLFASEHEARMFAQASSVDALAARLGDEGVPEVVLTMGADGSLAWTPSGGAEFQSAIPTVVVDPVGAGDAFVAGYLAGLLDRLPVTARLELGAQLGRAAVGTNGDWEGAPGRAALAAPSNDDVAR